VRTRSRIVVPFLLVLTLAAAACTGEDVPTPKHSNGSGGSPSPSQLPTVDPGATKFVQGEFAYELNGVTAELSWHGSAAELKVDNASGKELGPPGVYAVTDDQREVQAKVADAAAVADGGSATLQVVFPEDLDPRTTGILVLTFGEENWGAFAPVQES
jgi:hypothetical protein